MTDPAPDPYVFATPSEAAPILPAETAGSPFVFAGVSGDARADLAVTLHHAPQPTVVVSTTTASTNPAIQQAHAQLASALQLWLSELVRPR